MAPRLEYNDNVIFLFKCIESTGVKIDFNKAGAVLNIKTNAARMRYIRLRKAVEGELDGQISSAVLSTPQNSSRKKGLSAEKSESASKKRKILTDDEEVIATGEKSLNLSPGQDRLEAKIERRGTRGIKINFTDMLGDDDSLDGDDTDNEPSSFSQDSTASTLLECQVKKKTLPQKPNKSQRTPAASKKSFEPISSPLTHHDYHTGSERGAELTPPRSVKKRLHHIAQLDGDVDEDIRADFLGLANGHKIAGSMFKKRRLEVPGMAMPQAPQLQYARPAPSSRLARMETENASLDRYGKDSEVRNVIDDSISPDDSVSVANQAGADDAKDRRHAIEQTLMQKISSFWK